MALETEQKTYEREKSQLLPRAGKFVLISGEQVVGVYDTYADALKFGYDKFGLQPFMVKRIEAPETIHCFTRNIAACPT